MQLSFDAADRLVELVESCHGPVSAEDAARVLFALERAPATLAHSLLVDVVDGDARLTWLGARVGLAGEAGSGTLIEDAELVSLLADRQIPLGICPVSNISLGVYKTTAEHPIDALRRAGVSVSVNTDDPALLNTTLEESYEECASVFGWSKEIVRSLAATSVDASFADPSTKARIKNDLMAW